MMETHIKEESSDGGRTDSKRSILYGVEDVPSPPVCFLFGLQQAMMCIGATVSVPVIIPGLICAEGNNELTSKLMSITMFMCGVATIIQTLFGIRVRVVFRAMALTLLFSAYLANIKPPLPAWTMKRHCHVVRFPIFQLFSVILSMCASWLVCLVLTVTDVLPSNSTDPSYRVRTDTKIHTVEMAPWFYWPYPFQFGTPTVSTVGYVGFLVVTLVSVLESVCDYYAAACMSGAPPPPPHAVNRGIAMEGLASIVSGLVGAGHGTTSYSHNIGAIGIAKVASRAVFLSAGIILIVSGVVGKFGAVMTLIPDAVIGGTLTVLLSMIMGSGLSALKYVDLDSTRNLTILGTSLLLGLLMPEFSKNPDLAAKISSGIAI